MKGGGADGQTVVEFEIAFWISDFLFSGGW